jgi:hypothetical protein
MQTELLAITEVIRTYLDGLYEGDTRKLADAFHEVCHLYRVDDDGQVVDLPRGQWLAAVRARPVPREQGLPRADRIITIDVSGPESAFAKVECAIDSRFFTDYLSFLKIGDDWKIVSKTFRVEHRA